MGLQRDTNWLGGLPLAQAALGFAAARHRDQHREIDGAQFIVHPIEVARMLHRDGHPDHVIAAGLLHDVLEKTTTTRVELDRRFGARVTRIVGMVSDDPSLETYEERKRELRDRVAHADPDAVAVYTADKIAKVRELALLHPWQRNGSEASTKLTHYRASLQMLRRAAAGGPLVDRLEAELSQLAGLRMRGASAARALGAQARGTASPAEPVALS
jgi:(p)ppGpp synthase/HD superfamily hydrolase